jgi:hypothetical protein
MLFDEFLKCQLRIVGAISPTDMQTRFAVLLGELNRFE